MFGMPVFDGAQRRIAAMARHSVDWGKFDWPRREVSHSATEPSS